jgi:hypothetical protein
MKCSNSIFAHVVHGLNPSMDIKSTQPVSATNKNAPTSDPLLLNHLPLGRSIAGSFRSQLPTSQPLLGKTPMIPINPRQFIPKINLSV